MDTEKSALELRKAGYRTHQRDGVWWQCMGTGFCKPVDLLQVIERGTVRPRWSESFVGYSHIVLSPDQGNWAWYPMLLDNERLRTFGIHVIKPKRRAHLRKAFRELEIRLIQDPEPVLDEMNAICVAFAQRTGYGKPASYYTEKRSAWERLLRKQFQMAGREYWGAFVSGRLIAYYVTFLIEGTMYIGSSKSHTDFLSLYPNDAFAYRFLERCRASPDCRQVVFGDWSPDAPSLNTFKEQYGFVKTLVPVYRCERFLFKVASAIRAVRSRNKRIVESSADAPADQTAAS